MKKTTIFLLLSIIFFFSSCSKQTALQQLIHEADVVRIYIYNPSGSVHVRYATNDLQKIANWKNYIDETPLSAGNCNYEGRLVFKVYEDSTVMQFSLKEGCQQVAYTMRDTLFVKKLTKDGIDYLNGLKKIQ